MPNPAYTQTNRYKSPGSRYVGIVLVVLLHIGIIYALVYALGTRAIDILRGPIKVSNIEQPKQEEKQPPPPPPKMETPPPPYVPPPEINIQTPAPAATTAIQEVTHKIAPPPPPPPPKVGTPVRAIRIPNSDSYYPAISRRLGEEGSVVLQIYVNTQGRVADCKVAKSSGYDRLDKAACALAQAGEFAAAKSSAGQAMSEWITLPVKFRMQ